MLKAFLCTFCHHSFQKKNFSKRIQIHKQWPLLLVFLQLVEFVAINNVCLKYRILQNTTLLSVSKCWPRTFNTNFSPVNKCQKMSCNLSEGRKHKQFVTFGIEVPWSYKIFFSKTEMTKKKCWKLQHWSALCENSAFCNLIKCTCFMIH